MHTIFMIYLIFSIITMVAVIIINTDMQELSSTWGILLFIGAFWPLYWLAFIESFFRHKGDNQHDNSGWR
jgi:hypothetical protein